MMHDMKLHLLALGLVALGALLGCSEKPPVRAEYVPADCPTTTPAEPEEPVLLPVAEAEDEETEKGLPVAELVDVPLVDEQAEEEIVEVTIEQAEEIFVAEAIDLNTASISELMGLPGVGPALARRIVDYRARRPFERPDDVRRVKGIGPAKYAKMEAMLRVE